MLKKAAYVTAIAALIGAGLVNTFPAGAQESTSDATTTTQYPDCPGYSQMSDMMGDGYSNMTSDRQMSSYIADMMTGSLGSMMDVDHTNMMDDGQIDSHIADMTNGDHSSMIGGDYSNMMNGDFNHDFTGGMMGGASTPGDGPMSGRRVTTEGNE